MEPLDLRQAVAQRVSVAEGSHDLVAAQAEMKPGDAQFAPGHREVAVERDGLFEQGRGVRVVAAVERPDSF